MNTPSLSIITITKDDPVGLARTLVSTDIWRKQSGVEQLVVFSGDVPDISDQTVVTLRQTTVGIAGAFNEGLAMAQGEWVWFLNGGDAVHETLHPDWLKALLSATQAQVVTGSLHFDGEVSPRPMPALEYQSPLLACWLAHPATIIRRSQLRQIGGFAPQWKMAMDYDLWWRLFRTGVIVDVMSVPFARFNREGISERVDMRPWAKWEEMKVVMMNAHRLVLFGFWQGLRIFWRILRAILQWPWLAFAVGMSRRMPPKS